MQISIRRELVQAQSLQIWDRVFIPINSNNTHWYSACINFKAKTIRIYDSLRGQHGREMSMAGSGNPERLQFLERSLY